MIVVLITIHIMIAIAMIGVVLLQRTDQSGLGGLGGGGGSGGNFMSTRGQANLLSRTTAVLFAAFCVTSLALVLLSGPSNRPRSIADEVNPPAAPTQPAQPAVPLSR
ncbi:MAG: preprotein translocase subunit SecG [Rhodospirillaceae bacterium]|nr:preprotein translocase subunit SecG [Rhodospirillaceae bacterium]